MMSKLRVAVSTLAFFLTGLGTALLGATLPATLHLGHLSDSRGGLLLLAAWAGSTSGALLAMGVLDRTAALGLSLSAAALFVISGQSPSAMLSMYLLYGLGLGLTMTAISVLRSREVAAERSAIEMNRLNLVWAAGACTAPALALRSLRTLSLVTLDRSMALVFLALGVAMAVTSLFSARSVASTRDTSRSQLRWAPLTFGLFAAASVGLESAVGSWLATYAERTTLGVGIAVSANSAFWIGLLTSRAAHSVESASWFRSTLARRTHLLSVTVAIALLLSRPGPFWISCAAFLCGYGLGPLYPYVLSISLPRYRSTAVFVLAGVGASVVPWLTGALSTAANSLRIGLLVPAATVLLLLVTFVRVERDPTLVYAP